MYRVMPRTVIVMFLLVLATCWFCLGKAEAAESEPSTRQPVSTTGILANGNDRIEFQTEYWGQGLVVDALAPTGKFTGRPCFEAEQADMRARTFTDTLSCYTRPSQEYLVLVRRDTEDIIAARNAAPLKTIPTAIYLTVHWHDGAGEHMVITQGSSFPPIPAPELVGVMLNGFSVEDGRWKRDLMLGEGPVADAIYAGKWKQFGATADYPVKLRHFPSTQEMMRRERVKQAAAATQPALVLAHVDPAALEKAAATQPLGPPADIRSVVNLLSNGYETSLCINGVDERHDPVCDSGYGGPVLGGLRWGNNQIAFVCHKHKSTRTAWVKISIAIADKTGTKDIKVFEFSSHQDAEIEGEHVVTFQVPR